MSQASGAGTVTAPPEIIEIDLMEKFHWTPQEIGEIPYGKLQRLFAVMNQRENSREAAKEIIAKRESRKK